MKFKKLLIGSILLLAIFTLAACAGNNDEPSQNEDADTETEQSADEANGDQSTESESDSMEGMDHSSSGEVPAELASAESPTYPIGSEAVMNAQHMKGMDGAVATIEGAYSTTVYSVTYTPTTGGEKVEDHKWVIHEEIENAEEEPYQSGDEVVLNADHMKGMDGAEAVIESAEDTTVYMVTYTDVQTGDEVTNHKWVTESELSPVK
ncbi:hypothetical protein CIL03_08820 [Virgibacillus indicus]|uniref:DUF1541 domain-containing protein n=1 Tax=Virgibacillus indicus TaxID=2024554 RepID=A0A265NCB5_9BACI|nr:YdhK family protein [Virgibacillus indicus]OZU89104.1 hypothetical protein CIL03_08820 [Virgibacillus indicus]